MKTLYLDCGMGAAGDMLAGALLELLPDRESFLEEINGIGIPGVRVWAQDSVKCGIRGTHLHVCVGGEEEGAGGVHAHPHDHAQDHAHTHPHEHAEDHEHGHPHEHGHHSHGPGKPHGHHHRGMREIEEIIRELKLTDALRSEVLAVYRLIAEAESHVHGVPVTEIHFHEVGTMDAIADITAVCLLMEKLAPEQIIVSPVHVGSGQIRCAHGILPVPAPATAQILRGVPIYAGSVKGELCTPTGAALLTHFASAFGELPVMRVEKIGYGMGTKDFEAANCVRALLGEQAEAPERIYELSCNVDDMTAEEIAFAMERLFEAGALEAFTLPLLMKKSRPGTLLQALCRESVREQLVRAFFKYTSTLGVREQICSRYELSRAVTTIRTRCGDVRRKDASGYGVTRSKYEYDDLAKIALENDLSLSEVKEMLKEQ